MGKVQTNAKTKRETFIRAWRKHRRLSLQQVGDRIGVTKGALSQLENGAVAYTQPMLEALADVLACEPYDLLMRDPSDPEGIWATYQSLSPQQKAQAVEILKAIKRTA